MQRADPLDISSQYPHTNRIMNIKYPALPLLVALAIAGCGGNEPAQAPDTTATGTPAATPSDTAMARTDSPAVPAPVPADTADPVLGKVVSGGRYAVKSGIVEMKSANKKGLTATFYFDEFGDKIATYTSITDSLNGQPLIIRQVTIMADGWSVFFDDNHKVGMRSRMLEGTLNYYPNFDALSEREKVLLKYEKRDQRTIAGKQAQGHSIEQNGIRANAWTWNGIPLRTESGGMRGQWTMLEATSVQTDVPVPADKFVVPEGVKISDVKTTPRM